MVDSSNNPPTTIVFFGNPGSGKSTLGNVILGKVYFSSGFSSGKGRKVQLVGRSDKSEECVTQPSPANADNIRVADTMGLDDPDQRKIAAAQITEMLKNSEGPVKFIFVVKQNDGRIIGNDVSTIETVLDGIRLAEGQTLTYAVIINQIPRKTMKRIDKDYTNFLEMKYSLNSGKYKTDYILLLESIDDLESEDDAIVPVPFALRNFIDNAPSIRLTPPMVTEIDTSDKFEKILEQFKKDNEAFKRGNEELRQKVLDMMAKEEEKKAKSANPAFAGLTSQEILDALKTAAATGTAIWQTQRAHAEAVSARNAQQRSDLIKSGVAAVGLAASAASLFKR